jgi:predicted AAA+ superfamily ATPase
MSLYEITEKQVIERIQFDNPWWIQESIDSVYQDMRRRLYFNEFFSQVYTSTVKRAVVLMGPRRVGKTVLIYHTIQRLIEEGVNPRKICYLSIETPLFNGIPIEQLFLYCRRAVKMEEDTKDYYVFFDEIQYLKNWEIHLKSLVDSYHGAKFIVSGSAAAALKLKSEESGAGRFRDFTLPPLTFHEYIHLKGQQRLIVPKEKKWKDAAITVFDTINISKLNDQFINYINFGGYPEVSLSEEMQRNPGRYIKSDIVDKVLLRDLPSLYGIQDVQELNSLFTTIAFNTGNEFSYDKLSSNSGISKNTIKKYVSYLEAAFLIKVVNRIDASGKKFKRTSQFKIYLTNPSLRSALFAPVKPESSVMGNMVETAIYAQWFHRHWQTPYYARWKDGEVDIVGLSSSTLKPVWAVEVKWSNRFYEYPNELDSLFTFLEKNQMKRAVVTTIDSSGEKKYKDLSFDFMPAALYCYTVGRRMWE